MLKQFLYNEQVSETNFLAWHIHFVLGNLSYGKSTFRVKKKINLLADYASIQNTYDHI